MKFIYKIFKLNKLCRCRSIKCIYHSIQLGKTLVTLRRNIFLVTGFYLMFYGNQFSTPTPPIITLLPLPLSFTPFSLSLSLITNSPHFYCLSFSQNFPTLRSIYPVQPASFAPNVPTAMPGACECPSVDRMPVT